MINLPKIIKLIVLFLSIFLLTSCQTDNKIEATSKWLLSLNTSGGFDGRVELLTISSNGEIKVLDLIRKTEISGQIKNKESLDYIYSQLVIVKKKTKTQLKENSRINEFKLNSKCNDCQTTSLSFKLDNVDYSVSQKMKNNGKSIYSELMTKIYRLRKNSSLN